MCIYLDTFWPGGTKFGMVTRGRGMFVRFSHTPSEIGGTLVLPKIFGILPTLMQIELEQPNSAW